jgi:hypothetical protein
MADFETGDQMGFLRIPNDTVDEIGVKGVIDTIN